MPLPLNYMNSNFYYVHNFFCFFVHLGLTIFNFFLTFFIDSLRLSTAALADSLVRLPHLSLLCNPFFHFSLCSYEIGSSISLTYAYFHTQSTIVQPNRENSVFPCAILLFTFTLLSDKVSPTSEHGNDGPQ